MSFMGELGEIGVADLLYLVGIRQLTGKLTINANSEEVNLFLEDGNLALVTSTNQSLRLGRTFIRRGIIEASQLRDALEEQEMFGFTRPLGAILLGRGWVSKDQLVQCVEEQCIDVLARVIATEFGTFIYSSGIQAPHRTEIVSRNAGRVLMEATKRTDELRTLRQLLPAATALLTLSPDIGHEAAGLTDGEVLVAATLLSGAKSLEEVSIKMAMDELSLWRTILSLRERGLILSAECAGSDRELLDRFFTDVDTGDAADDGEAPSSRSSDH